MSIRTKLIISFLLLAILPSVIIAPSLSKNSKQAIENEFLKKEAQLVGVKVASVGEEINRYEDLVLMTELFPPIQGISRSVETGIDPTDGSTLNEWKERLTTTFSSIAKTDPNVYQVRYIDQDGVEFVRVDSRDGQIIAVEESNLQNKSDRSYVMEGRKLEDGQVYISPMTLNRENGEIELPATPTLRFVTPVYSDETNTYEGLIVINLFADDLLERIIGSREFTQIVVTDEQGRYLVHPDMEKEFSHEFGSSETYFTNQPELIENSKKYSEKVHHDYDEGEYRIWKKIFYRSNDRDHYWILYSVETEEHLFKPVASLELFFGAVWLGISIFIIIGSILIAYSISNPIKRITNVITEISKGNLSAKIDEDLLDSKDETGDLAHAFSRTIIGLKMAMESAKLEEPGAPKKPGEEDESEDKKDIKTFS